MIFVILGTQDKTFERMLKYIEKAKMEGIIKDKVIVQAGLTKYKSKHLEIFDFIPMNEFNNLIKEANLIITHGGVGSIIDSLKKNKKVIVIPRLSKYKEHENDHQLEIVEEFTKRGYILSFNNYRELKKCLSEVNHFKPKKYVSGNKKIVHIIEDFIDSL